MSISNFGLQDGSTLCNLFDPASEGVYVGMNAAYFQGTPFEGEWNPSFLLSFDPGTLFTQIEVAVYVRPPLLPSSVPAPERVLRQQCSTL